MSHRASWSSLHADRGHLSLPPASTAHRAHSMSSYKCPQLSQVLFSRTSSFHFSKIKHPQRPTNICKRLLQLQVSPASQAPAHPFTLPLCRSFLSPAGLFCPTAVSHLHPVFEKVWKKMGDTSTSFDFLVIVTQQPQF